MNFTPQKTMISPANFWATRASSRLSPMWSASFLNFGVLVVVGQDGGFSLSFQVEDLFGQGGGGEHGKRPAS